jgi:GntR family transcriptional regulator
MNMELATNHKFSVISEEIIAKIRTGEYRPGDKVPSENEIISVYGVSNTTARKALLDIELKGWARRIKGKGTFVLNRTTEHRLLRTLGSIGDTRVGFHEKLKAEGLDPKNIILEKVVLEEGVSLAVGTKHFIIEGPVLKLHQLRYANDILMKDETKYISLTLCPRINHLPTDISHYKVYEEKYHLSVSRLKQTLSCTLFEPGETSNHFEVAQAIPVFVLDSAVITSLEKVVELEHSYYRGDKYLFAIEAHPDF